MKNLIATVAAVVSTLAGMALFNFAGLATSGHTVQFLIWALKNETVEIVVFELVVGFFCFGALGLPIADSIKEG